VKHEIILKKNEIESLEDDKKVSAELVKYRERIK
jgi:hypothetical protein